MSAYAERPIVPVSTMDVEALERLVIIQEDLLANDVTLVRGESVADTMLVASGLAQKIKKEVGEPGDELEIGAIEVVPPELLVLGSARNLIVRPTNTELAA